jgi:hypothetical protein
MLDRVRKYFTSQYQGVRGLIRSRNYKPPKSNYVTKTAKKRNPNILSADRYNI